MFPIAIGSVLLICALVVIAIVVIILVVLLVLRGRPPAPPYPSHPTVRAPARVRCPAAAAHGTALATAAASGGTVAQTVIPRRDIARMELCP